MKEAFDLPAGYRMIHRKNLNIAVKEEYFDTFKDFNIPEVLPVTDDGSSHDGRARLLSLPLSESSGERALVRRCIRGGFFGRFFRELYVSRGTPRPFEELRISECARANGVSTPEIMAAAFERINPLFYRGALAVREISRGTDLQAELLSLERPLDRASLARKRRSIHALGRLIAKMHSAGIYHSDLHLKNVLSCNGADMYLLDLDAAKIYKPLSDFRKSLNILRLYRSAEKLNRRTGLITRTDLIRFIRSYSEGSPTTAKELSESLKKMLPVWRLKWKLSDLFGV